MNFITNPNELQNSTIALSTYCPPITVVPEMPSILTSTNSINIPGSDCYLRCGSVGMSENEVQEIIRIHLASSVIGLIIIGVSLFNLSKQTRNTNVYIIAFIIVGIIYFMIEFVTYVEKVATNDPSNGLCSSNASWLEMADLHSTDNLIYNKAVRGLLSAIFKYYFCFYGAM